MSNTNFTDLVLLVGTNPLPNFVVAEYFLQQNKNLKTIWLVHSTTEPALKQTGTRDFAKNLAEQFKDLQVTIEFVPLSNVSKAPEIVADFQQYCLQKLSPESSLHLNYTGGTQVMGTHVHQTIKQADSKKTINGASFSYLDARNFQIIDDEKGTVTDDLRYDENVALSFRELIALHGFERTNEAQARASKTDFPDVFKAFSRVMTEGRLPEFFDEEHGGYTRKLFENKKGDLATAKSQINSDALKAYIPNATFIEILESFPEDHRLIKDGELTLDLVSSKKCKHVIKFLDGFWFEDCLLTLLGQQFNVESNWEIAKKEWVKNFELDIILMQGYQLIGASCTTDRTQRLCKEKGFEVILRTRQIGGDEAKAILITCLSGEERDIVEQELRLDTGGGRNIMVLGIDDVKKDVFLHKIERFIQ